MTQFLQKVQQATTAALDQQKQQEEAKRAEARVREDELTDYWLNFFNAQMIQNLIMEAALKGQTSVRLSIFSHQDATPHWANAVIDNVRQIAANRGIKVDIIHDKMEPFGSDPLYTNTVHSCDAVFSWIVK